MVSVREREIIGQAQPEIKPEGPDNSFVGFLQQEAPRLDQFLQINSDYVDEERGWMQSPTFDQLVRQGMDFVLGNLDFGIPTRVVQRALEKSREKIARKVSSGLGEPIGFEDFGVRGVNTTKFERRLNYSQRQEFIEWQEKMREFTEDFRTATRPVKEALRETRQELFGKLGVYLQEEHNHFFDFERFLTNEEYAEIREQVRPFLAAIAENEYSAKQKGQGSIFEQAIRKLTGNLREGQQQEIIREFLDSTFDRPQKMNVALDAQRKEVVLSGDEEFKEWFMFGLSIAQEILPQIRVNNPELGDIRNLDTEVIFRYLPPFNRWPGSLKRQYQKFVSSKFHAGFGQVRLALEQFRHIETTAPDVVIFSGEFAKRKTRGESGIITDDQAEETGTVVEAQPLTYSIGVARRDEEGQAYIYVLSKEEIAGFLSKEAGKFAKADARKETDIINIMDSLLEDPYGYGTKKLTDRVVVIDRVTYPLRSFDSRKRPGIHLLHPDTQRMRVVYALDKQTRVVVLEGIYTHEEYDKKFLAS